MEVTIHFANLLVIANGNRFDMMHLIRGLTKYMTISIFKAPLPLKLDNIFCWQYFINGAKKVTTNRFLLVNKLQKLSFRTHNRFAINIRGSYE